MRVVGVVACILVAFVFHTVIARYFTFLASYLDLFTVLAAGFGLMRGRMVGMTTGLVGGLLQDAFSGGLLGFNGIAKTSVGYLAGIVGHNLIIRGWSTRLLFFAVATLADSAILAGVGHIAELPRVFGHGLNFFYLCLGNAFAGILLVKSLERGEHSELD